MTYEAAPAVIGLAAARAEGAPRVYDSLIKHAPSASEGKIRPLRVWGCLAVGKIMVPALARSQCEGGVIQGIGYALYEERQMDPRNGRVLSLGLEDYRIPGIGDIPEIEIHFIEEGFEHAKGGGVGLGELSTLAVAASVGNAVYHATGWRPYHLPIRPQRLLEGLAQ